ncbi:MAG: large conductance mechanosensitive channel protein MscL [Verrucomicrobiota bacterium]|jgi:large conductance mechanosensitive channel
MLNEFKRFILKGNVVDLSTGVIIGAAFGTIVTAFTKGIVEPILRLTGGGDMGKGLAWKIGTYVDEKGATVANQIDIGIMVNAIIGFLITAVAIFFGIVKPANKLMAMMKTEEAATPPPAPAEDIVLLAEIRDLLKK